MLRLRAAIRRLIRGGIDKTPAGITYNRSMSDIEILLPSGMPALEFAPNRNRWSGLSREALLLSSTGNHPYFSLALPGANIKACLPDRSAMIAAQ